MLVKKKPCTLKWFALAIEHNLYCVVKQLKNSGVCVCVYRRVTHFLFKSQGKLGDLKSLVVQN